MTTYAEHMNEYYADDDEPACCEVCGETAILTVSSNNPDWTDNYYCATHAQENGYCWACSEKATNLQANGACFDCNCQIHAQPLDDNELPF